MSEIMKAWGCSDPFEYEGGIINAGALMDHLKRDPGESVWFT